jgi:hypothetical protein
MDLKNAIHISDSHGGCQFALCPPEGVALDGGGRYMPSPLQLKMWDMWEEFCNKWIPDVTRGEPFALIHAGDALDGVHHNSTTQITQNLADQQKIAEAVLRPLVERSAVYYQIRGTPAHVGESGQYEEKLAKSLGAKPDENGNYARYELWYHIGTALVHVMHHIGTTGTAAYETTAVHKELTEAFVESARWRQEPPQFVIRGHRHRYTSTSIEAACGRASGIVLPGWQAKTPFAFKVPGGRNSLPQFGGLLIRQSPEEVYYREKVWCIERSNPE